jgi:predicted metal-dependent hydrolase
VRTQDEAIARGTSIIAPLLAAWYEKIRILHMQTYGREPPPQSAFEFTFNKTPTFSSLQGRVEHKKDVLMFYLPEQWALRSPQAEFDNDVRLLVAKFLSFGPTIKKGVMREVGARDPVYTIQKVVHNVRSEVYSIKDAPDLRTDEDILRIAEPLVAKYLPGVPVRISEQITSKGKSAAGITRMRARTGSTTWIVDYIGLAGATLRKAKEHDVHDVVLHEIAHGISGPFHYHDAVFRENAVRIGCSGTRCSNIMAD